MRKRFYQISGVAMALWLGLTLSVGTAQISAQSRSLEINRAPLKDLAAEVTQRVQEKKIDLSKSFTVEFQGATLKAGRLDTASINFTVAEGDAELVELAKKAITAANDSGYFQYVADFDPQTIGMRLEQNDASFSAHLSMVHDTANRAQTIRSGLDILLSLGKARLDRENATDRERSDLSLLKATSVQTLNSAVKISFTLPREQVRQLLLSSTSLQK